MIWNEPTGNPTVNWNLIQNKPKFTSKVSCVYLCLQVNGYIIFLIVFIEDSQYNIGLLFKLFRFYCSYKLHHSRI